MFCTKCGAAVQPAQRFCGSCGAALGAAPGPAAFAPQSRIGGNIKILGILWLIVAVIRLFPALILMGIFGVGASFLPDDVPFFVPSLMRGIGLLILAGSAAGLIAGWGLLDRQPWARTLAIVMGVLSLIEPPFGTALGIYTLWVLLPAQSEAEYRRLSLSNPVG